MKLLEQGSKALPTSLFDIGVSEIRDVPCLSLPFLTMGSSGVAVLLLLPCAISCRKPIQPEDYEPAEESMGHSADHLTVF